MQQLGTSAYAADVNSLGTGPSAHTQWQLAWAGLGRLAIGLAARPKYVLATSPVWSKTLTDA